MGTTTFSGPLVSTAGFTGGVYNGASEDELNRVADVSTRIVNATAATLAVSVAAHEGRTVTLNRAGGVAVTLPAATGSGARYRFVVGTTFTTAGTIKVTGNDTMVGNAILAQDAADTAVMFEAGATADTITMDGSTTGGLAGAFATCEDIAADLWAVHYVSAATGTEATPFSATVT